MIEVFKKLKLEKFLASLKEISIRFPISLLLIIIVSSLLFYITYCDFNYYSLSLDIYRKLIITGIISFFLATGIHLFKEKYNSNSFIYIIILIFIIIYLYYFGSLYNIDSELILYIILTFIGVIAFLFVSPFIFNYNKDFNKYHIFFYELIIGFLLATIIGILLFILGFIGISAVFLLFDIEFFDHNNLFIYWSIISFSIITPIYWLIKVPKSKITKGLVLNEGKFFGFIVKFIFLPFILIYFIILYSYTFKVLLNFGNWPNGEVIWLVIGFSFFGYLIYIFSYSLENKYLFILKFRKFFPFFVIPQIIMLFYAIYLRINQYDITIDRYLVISFGIWLLIISIYFIISKNKYLRFIPYSLMIIIILISIGPWGIYYIPEYRQIQRLTINLEKANILRNGIIYPLNNYTDISEELSKDIYGGIEYLCDYGNCRYIQYSLFTNQLQELSNEDYSNFQKGQKEKLSTEINNGEINNGEINNIEYRGLLKYEIVGEVTKQIKVRKYINDIQEKKYLDINLNNKNQRFPLLIKNYNFIINIYGIKNEQEEASTKDESLYFLLNQDTEILYLKSFKNIIFKKSIKGIFNNLQTKVSKLGENSIESEDLIFEMQFNNDNIKIFFDELSILNPKYTLENGDTYNYVNTKGYVLSTGKEYIEK